MFDIGGMGGGAESGTAVRLDAVVVAGWREQLTAAATAGVELSDAARVDLLRALEELACAAAGVQAVVTAGFDASQRAAQAVAGVPAELRGRGVGAQVGLARRVSPHRGTGYLGLARVLTRELPHTLAALTGGRITQWRATVIARETACLSREHRTIVDDRLAGTPDRAADLEAWSDRRLLAELARLAQELDVQAVVERRRRATEDRRVTGRPAPDTMMYLTALLPATDGVAVLAALQTAATQATGRPGGDPRTRSQLMADTLVDRVTGRDPVTTPTPITMNLVLPATTLLGDREEPAHLDGYGPIPAELARELVTAAQAAGLESVVRLRRLYAIPATGALVAMESAARLFPDALAQLIRLRDQTCRTPWCNAPIRHTDHVIPHAQGGPTSAANGQGLCQACNHAKQAPDWHATPTDTGGRHTVITTTPTGHTYRSTAPPLAS